MVLGAALRGDHRALCSMASCWVIWSCPLLCTPASGRGLHVRASRCQHRNLDSFDVCVNNSLSSLSLL